MTPPPHPLRVGLLVGSGQARPVGGYYKEVYAVDALGNIAPGFPVPAQDAYPSGMIGNGLDAYGGEAGGPEGIRFEVPVALPTDITFRRVVVTDRHGESLGMETFVPDLSDGTIAWSVLGNALRSRVDPNGVMYVAFRNYNTAGVVGLRPHPLPPSWLALGMWRGTLGPGESVEITLTFSAGESAVGDYAASLQVIEAETGAVTEVPLALTVMLGTGMEDGPEGDQSLVLSVYPNPARARAGVMFTLPEAGVAEVGLYDVLGRRVTVLHAGLLGAGEHALPLDVAGLPAGVYVVRVAAGSTVVSHTVTVLR